MCKIQLGWQYGMRLKFHGAVTKWCTGRGWPVNCKTVISARWWSTPVTQKKERKLHVPLASYGWRLRGRGDVFISPCMGSMMIKPVNPKRAEVACSIGQLWEEIGWAKRRVHISAWEIDGNIRSTILNGRSTILNGRQRNSAVHTSLARRYPEKCNLFVFGLKLTIYNSKWKG